MKKSFIGDWTLRESVRAKIKVMVKRILTKHGYPVLQTTTSLQGTPVWTNAGNLTLSGTNYVLTNAIDDTARYFRLQTK